MVWVRDHNSLSLSPVNNFLYHVNFERNKKSSSTLYIIDSQHTKTDRSYSCGNKMTELSYLDAPRRACEVMAEKPVLV